MPKVFLYAAAAVGNLIVAYLAYRGGRIVIPAILALAAFCFIMATIGQARSGGGPKANQ
jgi:hypothetical protein